jgi:uncharacterized protein YutE (UPF0331/DUF86 family)
MEIMDWRDCCKKLLAKEISPDLNLVKSLISSSENKNKTQGLLPLNKETASSKVSLSYDALRQLLEALAIKENYKIYNHECYTSFLKEIVKKSELGDRFESLRKIRNSINYYGKELNEEEAKETLEKINSLIEKIKKELN